MGSGGERKVEADVHGCGRVGGREEYLDAVEELVESSRRKLGDLEQDAGGCAKADIAARNGVGPRGQLDAAIVRYGVRVTEVRQLLLDKRLETHDSADLEF
jgi:hypothetical protein